MSLAIPRDLARAVRSGNLFSNRSSSALDTPEPGHVASSIRAAGFKRNAAVTEMPLRRDSSSTTDYSDDYFDDLAPGGEFTGRARGQGVRLSFHGGLVPKTLWGRIAAGIGLLLLIGVAIAGGLWVQNFVLHDEHFVVPSSDSIQIAGNSHVTRAQLLSVFGEDVDRNVFNIPLAERRTELESLPWVAHATVMRLLPNRIRVAIVERTPVAFIRQGAAIGLVDTNGVLFDLPGPDTEDAGSSGNVAAPARNNPHYSFPVLTGISAGDPLSTRAARMRIYMSFVAALDATGEDISPHLSEVDLSNPEDVKAIIPDAGSAGADILVHFGEDRFLERYHQFQQRLAEWRTQYPRLASVDMRYERQVVLEMQPGAPVPSGDGTPAGGAKESATTAPAKVAAATKQHATVLKSALAREKWLAKVNRLKAEAISADAASQGAPR